MVQKRKKSDSKLTESRFVAYYKPVLFIFLLYKVSLEPFDDGTLNIISLVVISLLTLIPIIKNLKFNLKDGLELNVTPAKAPKNVYNQKIGKHMNNYNFTPSLPTQKITKTDTIKSQKELIIEKSDEINSHDYSK